MKPAKAWYRFENMADDPSAVDIYVYDIIGGWIDDLYGWGGVTTAKTFLDELSKLGESVTTIRVRINSPGGDVFSAVAIANALRDQQTSKGRTVETICEGLAASAASIILMAGRTVLVADNALVMIHNPWTVAIGNAAEMRKCAEELDTVRSSIVATYQWHSELDAKAIATLMDDETWMDADDALTYGFATEKVEGLKAAASIDRRAMASLKVPDRFRGRVDGLAAPDQPASPPTQPPPVAATASQILSACREGGCMDLAEGLVAASATLEQVQAKVAEAKEAQRQAQARTTEIAGIVAAAKLPAEFAVRFDGMSIANVRAAVTDMKALLDKAEIDSGLDPDRGNTTAAAWTDAFKAVTTTRYGAH